MTLPEPTILGFDTSAAHCAAALLMNGKIVAERFEEMKKGQAERLFPMLDEVMGDVGAVWEELDSIGVGTGPGNFTGTRVSVSAARGLALSLSVPAIGVSGFEAMAGPQLLGEGTRMIVSIPSERRDSDVMLQLFEGGVRSGEPVELGLNDKAPYDRERIMHLPVDTFVCGERADLLDCIFNERRGFLSNYRSLKGSSREAASSVARVAAWRMTAGHTVQAPAPLYIRPPDAAPSADPSPVILP
ncbi:MAG: tRNA (adenosine(37)-N6)-threonylcarbamoyltransferase complex dimerization subunit type 1 TsaB [Pseudomonadota bacterium]